MSKINWKTRKSRVASEICAWFKKHRNEDLSFGKILDKYCDVGMSRNRVTMILTGITLSKLNFSPTSIWDAWQMERAHGRTDFIFNSKFPGNRHHGNRGIIRKTKKEKSIVIDTQKIDIKYYCTTCKSVSEKETNITKAPMRLIGLKVYRCPECGNFSSCVARFLIDGKTTYKKITKGREIFIKPGGKKQDLPRKEVAHE